MEYQDSLSSESEVGPLCEKVLQSKAAYDPEIRDDPQQNQGTRDLRLVKAVPIPPGILHLNMSFPDLLPVVLRT